MQIDWAAFTPWSALAGGAIIGLSAVLFALLTGRIAGVSSILGGLLRPVRGDLGWRLGFVGGMVVSPVVYSLFAAPPSVRIEGTIGLILAAGLLVGWGARLGSGCTSGHGVCGLARRSPRSLVATLAFMVSGFLTVFVARHVLP